MHMIMSSRVLGQRLCTTSQRLIQHRSIMVPAASAKGIRPSATLIVAAPYIGNKQGKSDYRVLMMKRNAKSSFINAHVFPGGVVDKHDDAFLWQPILGLSNNAKQQEVTHKICAIRETFEESGLLLTHPPAHTVLQDSVREEWRLKVHEDASQFKVLCETFKLTPAVDKLLPFANWITPEAEKRRYNTHFFLTMLDDASVTKRIEGEAALAADGKETVQLDWLTPEQALDANNDKKIVLFPPQWYTLKVLHEAGAFAQLEQAGIGALRRRDGSVSTVMPQMNPTPEKEPMAKEGFHAYLAYPGDETYLDLVTGQPTGTKGQRHRIYFKGRMENYRIEKNVDVSDIVAGKANL